MDASFSGARRFEGQRVADLMDGPGVIHFHDLRVESGHFRNGHKIYLMNYIGHFTDSLIGSTNVLLGK